MSFYSDASLVMIPSGYKTSKVYSAVPTDGAGDLSFSRSNDTATRVNSAGLIEKVRTNVLLYSNDFSNAAWGTSNATLTGGQSGYDGTTNGWKLEATATSCYISQGTYSVLRNHSIYVKAGTFNLVSIIVGGYGQGVTFNLTTGAVVTNTNSALYSPVITSVGSGWYRISVGIQAAAPTYGMLIAPNDINGGTISAGQFIYIQAAQTEYNDIATDYIATTSSAVSVGPVANVPRLDYLGSSCPRLLLEPQRTNLATYSEQANQYSLVRATIGSNVLASPDGTSNADSLIEDADNGAHAFFSFGLTTFTAAAYTASVFAKKGSRDWCALQIYDGTQGFTAYFNLNTGVAGSVGAGATSTITNYGNGWYRCTITATTAAGSTGGIAIYSAISNNSISYAGTNGLTAGYFYGWQLELGAYATSYIPTLGAAVTRGADAASKTSASALIGQTEGTIFVDFNHDISVTASFDSRIQLSDGTAGQWIFMGFPDGGTKLLRMYVNNISGALSFYSSTGVIQGRNKAAFAYKSGDFMVYLNGVQVASNTTAHAIPPCSRIDLQGGSPTAATAERENINQALLFKTRLSNADLAALTTI